MVSLIRVVTVKWKKWLDFGYILKVEPARFAVESDGECERMKGVKNNSRVSGLNNWKKGLGIYGKRRADLKRKNRSEVSVCLRCLISDVMKPVALTSQLLYSQDPLEPVDITLVAWNQGFSSPQATSIFPSTCYWTFRSIPQPIKYPSQSVGIYIWV